MTIVTRSPRMYTHKRLHFFPGCDPILLHVPSKIHSNVMPSLTSPALQIDTRTVVANYRALTTTPTTHVNILQALCEDIEPKHAPQATKSTQTVITSSMIHTPEVKSPSFNQHIIKTHKLSPKITIPNKH